VDLYPPRSGGTGVKSALKTHVMEYPWRFEFGTLNSIGIAALLAGQEWIAAHGGVEQIYEHEMRLARRLEAGLREIPNVILYCADTSKDHLPVISFNIENMDASQTGTMLDVDYDVITRTGLQCAPLVHEGIGTIDLNGTVRFSVGPFNTEDHVDRALRATEEIAAFAKEQYSSRA
jgi:cysteine desulfurase/selenocysteine lyase